MIRRREFLLPATTLGALLLAGNPAQRAVAITIDDLPRGGDWPKPSTVAELLKLNRDFLAPFLRGKIPLTGFVNAGRTGLTPPQLDQLLRLWLHAGAELGNHTHTHPDLNNTPLETYVANIVECHLSLSRVTKPRYFRHPFLHAGPDEAKRQGLERFLAGQGYRVAPVTLDNSDYMFAALYGHAVAKHDQAAASQIRAAYLPYLDSIFAFFEQRSVEVFGREIPQVLLLHVSLLNAHAMPDILAMIARRGYRIDPLEAVLSDPAFQSRDAYYGRGGFSWIHRWSRTMGLPNRGEPDEPAFIRAGFERLQSR